MLSDYRNVRAYISTQCEMQWMLTPSMNHRNKALTCLCAFEGTAQPTLQTSCMSMQELVRVVRTSILPGTTFGPGVQIIPGRLLLLPVISTVRISEDINMLLKNDRKYNEFHKWREQNPLGNWNLCMFKYLSN